MPLDPRKAAHIQQIVNKTFAGRTKTVVFVYQAAGVYSYVAISVIFRPESIIDPQIPDSAGIPPRLYFDMLCIAPLGTNFTGVAFIADTTTATAAAVASAKKYEIIEAVPQGIVPTGTHIEAKLRRLR